MKVATWNVNSIRSRLDRLLGWLETHQPDVLCLQELKVTDDKFPHLEVKERGYYALVLGQKTYNGVAILSRAEPRDPSYGFDDNAPDEPARLLAATLEGVRVYSAYFPNGGSPVSDKYAYKLGWMERLRRTLDARHSPSEAVALCGDFNVAPEDKDVARPEDWADTVLCRPEVREKLTYIRDFGFHDVVEAHHPSGGLYSWWDYRNLGFPKGNGLRIDHIYATSSLAKKCSAAGVDRNERKGKLPSDHAPVWAEFT